MADTPLLTLRPNASRDATNQPLTPTANGALRVINNEWLIEEGTTNYVANPLAWNDLEGYEITTGVTLDRITEGEHAPYIRVNTDGSEPYQHAVFYYETPPLAELPDPYTATVSVSMKTQDTVALVARVYIDGWSGTHDVPLPVEGTGGDWARLSSTVTSDPGDTISDTRIIVASSWYGDSLETHVDTSEWQIEQKDHATTFCPQLDSQGNLLDGYAWTGVPHASPSTREAASLSAPIPSTWKSLYIRYHEGDGTLTNAYMTDEGTIGEYGTLSIADDTATFSSGRALYLNGALFFERELTETEQGILDQRSTLDWNALVQDPRMVAMQRLKLINLSV